MIAFANPESYQNSLWTPEHFVTFAIENNQQRGQSGSKSRRWRFTDILVFTSMRFISDTKAFSIPRAITKPFSVRTKVSINIFQITQLRVVERTTSHTFTEVTSQSKTTSKGNGDLSPSSPKQPTNQLVGQSTKFISQVTRYNPKRALLKSQQNMHHISTHSDLSCKSILDMLFRWKQLLPANSSIIIHLASSPIPSWSLGRTGLGAHLILTCMEMLYNKLSRLLPVHFFLHVRSIAAAIIGQEQSSIAQPVHIHFYTGAVHDDHVGVGRLSGHLQSHKNEKYYMQETWQVLQRLSQSSARTFPTNGGKRMVLHTVQLTFSTYFRPS